MSDWRASFPREQGWNILDEEADGFDAVLGPIMLRPIPDGVEVRIGGGDDRLNVLRGVHGGFLSAFAEQCLFMPLYVHGRIGRNGVVTVALSLQYVRQADPLRPLGARITVIRETGRMAFLQGMIEQDDEPVAMFAGTVRKLPPAA